MAERIRHGFGPVWNGDSRVLILGSMPSVKSLEQGFYYAHPQNRFWRVLAEVTGQVPPATVEGRRAYLLARKIAVWDVLESCFRDGSLDAAIRDPLPNDIPSLLQSTKISAIFTNGRAAEKYLKKFFPAISSVCLPSTSPANAGGFRLQDWLCIRDYL